MAVTSEMPEKQDTVGFKSLIVRTDILGQMPLLQYLELMQVSSKHMLHDSSSEVLFTGCAARSTMRC